MDAIRFGDLALALGILSIVSYLLALPRRLVAAMSTPAVADAPAPAF